HEGLQDEHRRPDDQYQQHQQHGERQVQLGKAPYALVQAGNHRNGRQGGGGDDQHDLHRYRDGQAIQMVETGVDLSDADPQRGGDAEHRADDGEDVRRMADGAVDALADQWIERRTQGQGQAMAVGEIGQDHRHDGVDRPGMQAPVEEGDLDRLARGGNGAAFAGGGRDEVHHRL